VGSKVALVVEDQFFGGQPTHALNEAALDLAPVDGRVQRPADVVQDIDAQGAVLAGQGVDDHLGAGRAVGVVVERMAGVGGAVVVDLRGGVIAGR